MKDAPLISIIIPVFNAGRTLQSTIESILVQSYGNIELIIVDGESADNTKEIIARYKKDINIFICEKDNGIYDAMNKGINASNGDWLLFLGGDDILYNSEILASIFIDSNFDQVDFLYGDVLFKSNSLKYGGEKDYPTLLDSNICHQSIFYHKKIFEKIGNYNLRYQVLADFDMNIRVFKNESIRKKYIPKIITLFNDKGTSNSVLDRYFYSDMLSVFQKEKEFNFRSPYLQRYYFYSGIVNMCSNKIILAFKQIPLSWLIGRRKLFYFLFTFKFLLRILIRDEIKIK
jgi:glycosyltransferase involved in cell wall biosynthesis